MSDVRGCQQRGQIVGQRDTGAAQFVLLVPRVMARSVDQTKHALNNDQKLQIFQMNSISEINKSQVFKVRT